MNRRKHPDFPKRHHHTFRHLINGFACRATGRGERAEHYAWHFAIGRPVPPPAPINTKGIWSEGYFYGKPNEYHVEKKNARDEARYGRMLNVLRQHSGRVVEPEICDLAAEFIVHFVRSRYVRAEITDTMRSAATDFAGRLADADYVNAMADEVLARLPAFARVGAREKVIEMLRGRQSGMEDLVRLGFLDNICRINHMWMTAQDFAKFGVAVALREWAWAIVADAPGTFILGDVGPVGKFDGSAELGPVISLHRPRGRARAVFLPIAHDRVLVAWPDDVQPTAEAEILNVAAAVFSRDSFVAYAGCPRECAYAARIGSE